MNLINLISLFSVGEFFRKENIQFTSWSLFLFLNCSWRADFNTTSGCLINSGLYKTKVGGVTAVRYPIGGGFESLCNHLFTLASNVPIFSKQKNINGSTKFRNFSVKWIFTQNPSFCDITETIRSFSKKVTFFLEILNFSNQPIFFSKKS